MNIFEAENLIKKIEKGNIKFPRITKPNGFERVKLCRDKAPDFVQLKIPEHFETDDTISALIYSIEQSVIKHNVEFIDSWFYEMLAKYGVKKEDLLKRVSLQISGVTKHIFIDGDYAFSFTNGIDWNENGQIYTIWVKPEYFSEMRGDKQ